MKRLVLIITLSFTHSLFGQEVQKTDPTKFKVSETFWAKENKVYVDSVEMELSKTYLDTNNIAEIIFFKDNPQSLHKNRGATLITRKNKVDFVGLSDLLKSLKISDSTKVKFIVDGDLITDTSAVRFEPLAIVHIEILKNSSNQVDHGFDRYVNILVKTQWRRNKIER